MGGQALNKSIADQFLDLKNSLDYGLKIAPDIINLAATYYKAKGI